MNISAKLIARDKVPREPERVHILFFDPVHGKDKVVWDDYLAQFEPALQPHLIAIRGAVETNDLTRLSGVKFDKAGVAFATVAGDDARYFMFSQRAWAYLIQSIVGMGEGYNAYLNNSDDTSE